MILAMQEDGRSEFVIDRTGADVHQGLLTTCLKIIG